MAEINKPCKFLPNYPTYWLDGGRLEIAVGTEIPYPFIALQRLKTTRRILHHTLVNFKHLEELFTADLSSEEIF
jgi:hypothetical protein